MSTVSSLPGMGAQWELAQGWVCVSERTGSSVALRFLLETLPPLAVLRDVKERGCKAGSRVARAFPGLYKRL